MSSADPTIITGSPIRLEKIYQAIEEIKVGTRRSVWLMSLGLFSMAASVAASATYLSGTYADLSKAKAELRQSAKSAEIVQSNLASARIVLGQIRAEDGRGSQARINQAIQRVSAGEAGLYDISYSIKTASRLLPVHGEPKSGPSGERWFVVVETYSSTPEGERLARLRMEQLDHSGLCSQIWRTTSSNMLSVVLGDPANQQVAADRAKLAGTNNLTAAAYARLDVRKNWKSIARSARCTSSSTSLGDTA